VASVSTITYLRRDMTDWPETRPSLSIVIPARNECGNIRHALNRLPDFGGAEVEVIFVEGHSTDGTWNEICGVLTEFAANHENKAVVSSHGNVEGVSSISKARLRVLALQQAGIGKADAVRLGLTAATGELVTILDADLTMPPEALADFYEAYCQGRGDFINGDRLTLPMEYGAMRPLNKLGNKFFAWALSNVLDTPLADCLCGTKLFARHDYTRFAAWREDFGEWDPFGDFDLLFPAAMLAIGCVDVPICYAARTYGETNIRRYRDGARLLRMTVRGWRSLKTRRYQ